MAHPVSEVYRQAIRSGAAVWYTVDATLGGVPIAGATNLHPTGGTITDTTRPGVRRTLSLELPPQPGLFDRLSPIGTMLKVWAHVRLANRTVVDIPMGMFDVDQEKFSDGGGSLSLTAPDKWARIQRARFVLPGKSYPNVTVVEQIARMIRDALGPGEQVNILSTNATPMRKMVWEKDRDKAINDLAKSIGAWVYFDRDGVATIANQPTTGGSAHWLIDSSASGVLTELDRERSRANTYNVVVVSSTASSGEAFPLQYVWDNDVNSPTYAGTGPPFAVGVGPFGIAPYYHDTPLSLTAAGARAAGRAILSRVVGLASQVSLGQVPNPAVDAFDVIDVLPPRERYDIARVLERHVVDTVTHPLTLGPAQQIEGRSTRTDEFT